MIARLSEACLDDRAFVTQPLLGPAESQGLRGQRGTAEIAELNALEVVPDALFRVELGGRVLVRDAVSAGAAAAAALVCKLPSWHSVGCGCPGREDVAAEDRSKQGRDKEETTQGYHVQRSFATCARERTVSSHGCPLWFSE